MQMQQEGLGGVGGFLDPAAPFLARPPPGQFPEHDSHHDARHTHRHSNDRHDE